MNDYKGGLIYTFYSYKGGVGRSMALANIATYFYQRRNLNVLMVDWDLEAPGLERYFAERFQFEVKTAADKPGLIDLLQRYKNNLRNPPGSPEDSPYPPLEDYLTVLEAKDDSRLMLLSAGQRGTPETWKQYAQFIQGFDWADFYKNWAGGGFIDWLRDELRHQADVILIDSRTGLTEIGGVATQHMADVVVILFASNGENMENSARMASNFLSAEVKQGRKGQPLPVITVPSRVDDYDSKSYGAFLEDLREKFTGFQRQEFGRAPLQDMLVPYLPLFSYKEAILFGNLEHESVGQRIVSAYIAIASNMIALAPETHPMRVGKQQSSRRGQVFISYPNEHFKIAEEIRIRLLKDNIEVQANFAPETWVKGNYDEDQQQIERSACLIVLVDEKTSKSRLVLQYIDLAQEMRKPIIPLMLTPNSAALPLQLRSIQYLDWSRQNRPRTWDHLLKSIMRYLDTDFVPATEVHFSRPTNAKHRLYISYSRQDSHDIAQRLTQDLMDRHFEVFIDDRLITAGQDWANVLEEALSEADVLLVLLSPGSVRSQFVRSEIAFAQQLGKRIMPLMVSHTNIPLPLINIQYIDFTKDYQTGLETLVKSLQKL